MKKQVKKLMLAKETMRNLESQLKEVEGGLPPNTRLPCESISCGALCTSVNCW